MSLRDQVLGVIAAERRTLARLADALARQRAGMAAGDAGAVGAANHEVARAVLGLGEIRRRREDLAEALTEHRGSGLGLVLAAVGNLPDVATARADLREAAGAVVRDLEVALGQLRAEIRRGNGVVEELVRQA